MQNFQKLFWPLTLLSALIFQGLFYQLNPGLNYALYSLFIILILVFYVRPESYSHTYKLVFALFLSSSVAVMFVHTTYSFFIYWLITIMLVTSACYSQIKHLQLIPLLFLNRIENVVYMRSVNGKIGNSGKLGGLIRFIFLPLITIAVLLWVYSASNKQFSESISWLTDFLSRMLKEISIGRLFFALMGFVLGSLLIAGKVAPSFLSLDQKSDNDLIRVRSKNRNITGLSKLLLRKKQVAIATFVILNVMIAWLNYLDIKLIWIDFDWDGGFLKDMLHEGTNLLIFAILISIAITLFYLNSNLVFLKNNRLFYGLLLLWLLQNVLMAASVWIRNSIYIEHFSLAYKRIFVYFFLVACIIGLMSIMYKILFKKSIGFVVSVNSLSVVLILVTGAFFNWDVLIAKHNFKHYKTSFVHYRFLAKLNDSALPYLSKTQTELDAIYADQVQKFPFISGREYEQINYSEVIQKRKAAFLKRWESKSILEWNYPEYKTYLLLKK